MQRCKKMLRLSRGLGRCSAFCFLLALLGVLDGLQNMMRHDYNQVDAVVGETVIVTGNLPPGKGSLDELTVHLTGDEAVSFRFTEMFSGFWFGGNMWRGELSIPASAKPQQMSLTVEDIWEDEQGTRQNPTLIYPVYIWADSAEKDRHGRSLFLSYAAMHPFPVGGTAAVAALFFAAGQWFLLRRAGSLLEADGYCFVHGVKKNEDGMSVLFTPCPASCLPGTPVTLLTPQLENAGAGQVVDVSPQGGTALFPSATTPGYGWFIRPC